MNSVPLSIDDAPPELNVWDLDGWKLIEEGTAFTYVETLDENDEVV